jgi:hypothetical protein
MRTGRFLTLAPALVLVPSGAASQGIRGSVSERESGEAIVAALVQLVARDSTVLVSAFSDDSGRFTIQADDCGPQDGYLYVARVGYGTFRVAIADLPVDCSNWSIALDTDPVGLPALTARAPRNRDLERVGFHDRQRIGLGTFITRDILADRYRTVSQIADVLKQTPGVYRVDQTNSSSTVYLRLIANFGGPCAAVIYIDGLFYQNELPRLLAQDIEAIEIYRGPAQVPIQYGGGYGGCGVVLIWTRTGAGR